MVTKAGEGINRKEAPRLSCKDGGWRQKNKVDALESLSHAQL